MATESGINSVYRMGLAKISPVLMTGASERSLPVINTIMKSKLRRGISLRF